MWSFTPIATSNPPSSLCAELRAEGAHAVAAQFDVTDQAACGRAMTALLDTGPPIQVLVNNAGIHDDAVSPGMSRTQWDSVIDVGLNGFFNVTQPLSMPMIRSRWGRIVTISSIAGLTGNRGQVNYAAAKGALHAATKSCRLNWRPEESPSTRSRPASSIRT